jgi:hypothetical protein
MQVISYFLSIINASLLVMNTVIFGIFIEAHSAVRGFRWVYFLHGDLCLEFLGQCLRTRFERLPSKDNAVNWCLRTTA